MFRTNWCRLPEVPSEGRHEALNFLSRPFKRKRAVRIDPNQSSDKSRQPPCSLQDHIAAHRVADEDEIVQPELIHDGRDVASEGSHRPVFAVDPRFTVTRQVDRHDFELSGEGFPLQLPVAAIARPAMDQQQRWSADPDDVISDLRAIERGCEAGHVATPDVRCERRTPDGKAGWWPSARRRS
jgi:hypothetical protein